MTDNILNPIANSILGEASSHPFAEYQLGKEEVYDPAKVKVLSFKQVTDIVDGLECRFSNMAGGFPFPFLCKVWANSEVLYLCGEYSNDTPEHHAIQQELLRATSGYGAKRFIKAKHKKEVRPDFKEFRLQWMLFVVWQKCKGNKAFCERLLQSPADSILVENTTTDNGGTAEVWGCKNPLLVKARKALAEQLKASNSHLSKKALELLLNIETNKLQAIDTWKRQNNIGKILMICRKALQLGVEPPIDYSLLSQYNIHILGHKVNFSQYDTNKQ